MCKLDFNNYYHENVTIYFLHINLMKHSLYFRSHNIQHILAKTTFLFTLQVINFNIQKGKCQELDLQQVIQKTNKRATRRLPPLVDGREDT